MEPGHFLSMPGDPVYRYIPNLDRWSDLLGVNENVDL